MMFMVVLILVQRLNVGVCLEQVTLKLRVPNNRMNY